MSEHCEALMASKTIKESLCGHAPQNSKPKNLS